MKILSIVLTSVLGLCMIQSVFGTERPSDTNKESSTALVENYKPVNDVCGLNFNVECVVEKNNKEIVAAPIWMKRGQFYKGEYKILYSVNKETCEMFQVIYLETLKLVNEEDKLFKCTK
mgnify:FL=1